MTKAIESNYYTQYDEERTLTQNELGFFKNELEAKKIKIEQSLKESTNEFNANTQYDAKDEGDHASLEINNNINSVIFKEQSKTLQQINRSLNKIIIGSYGVCHLCEEPINIERLKVKIFAEYCITCREIMEKQQ